MTDPRAPHYPAPYVHYPAAHVAPKSTIGATALGALVPGAGDLYGGRTGRGLTIMAVTFVCWLSVVILVGFLLIPVCSIVGAITGYKAAQRWNRDHGIVS